MKHYCGTGNNRLVAARSIGIVVFCQCKASTIFRTLSPKLYRWAVLLAVSVLMTEH